MKKIMSILAVSGLALVSASSFAQSAQEVQTLNSYGNYSYAQTNQSPITRAQVKAELVDLEKAGYNPNMANDPNYPADLQKAEKKVWLEHHQAQ
jgi:hypothetical protein